MSVSTTSEAGLQPFLRKDIPRRSESLALEISRLRQQASIARIPGVSHVSAGAALVRRRLNKRLVGAFSLRVPLDRSDGGLKFGSDLSALGAVGAIAQFNLKKFDLFVNALHRRKLSLEGAGEEPASPWGDRRVEASVRGVPDDDLLGGVVAGGGGDVAVDRPEFRRRETFELRFIWQ